MERAKQSLEESMDFLSLLMYIPYGKEILIGLGTATAALTVVGPIVATAAKKVAEITKTKADDDLIKKAGNSAVVKSISWLAKQLNRFSLLK